MALEITISIQIPASAELTWSYLSLISDHVNWMLDAESIDFDTPQQSGPGTEFVCATRVGPIRLKDRMTVTDWQEGKSISIAHKGLVTGTGVLAQLRLGELLTEVTWSEQLVFGWLYGGRAGELLAGTVLRRIWRRNLRQLSDRILKDPLGHKGSLT